MPKHRASRKQQALGHTHTVALLLHYGADLDVARSGYSSLLRATVKGHSEIMNLLIQHGADVSAVKKGYDLVGRVTYDQILW